MRKIDVHLTKEQRNPESLQELVDRIAAENDDGEDITINFITPPVEYEDALRWYPDHSERVEFEL